MSKPMVMEKDNFQIWTCYTSTERLQKLKNFHEISTLKGFNKGSVKVYLFTITFSFREIVKTELFKETENLDIKKGSHTSDIPLRK